MASRWPAVGRRRSWIVVLVLAPVLLLVTPHAAAATKKSLHGAAFGHMKYFMQIYDRDGFSKVVDAGRLTAYKKRLFRTKIVVDPKYGERARYDPDTNTLTLSKDPRRLRGAGSIYAWGETIWHEITHAIEDDCGDPFTGDRLFDERNVDYMTHVWKNALPLLCFLEKRAKAGASVAQLKKIWNKFLKEMAAAEKLPSTSKYPPDLQLIRGWFGFHADAGQIRRLYLSGKVLPGKRGKNLRKALAAMFAPADWAGTWSHSSLGELTLNVSGTSATGVWKLKHADETLTGTISPDGCTMTGSWRERTNLVNGPQYRVMSFTATLHNDPPGNWYITGYYVIDQGSYHYDFGLTRQSR